MTLLSAAPAKHDSLFTAYLADEAAPRHKQRIRELLHTLRAVAETGEDTRIGHISGKEPGLRDRDKAFLARMATGRGAKDEKEKLRNDEAFAVMLAAGAAWAKEESTALKAQWGASQIQAYLADLLVAPLRAALQHILGSFSTQNHLYLLPVLSACAAHEASETEPVRGLAKEIGKHAEALLARLQESELARLSSPSASVSGFPRYVDLCIRLRPPPAILKVIAPLCSQCRFAISACLMFFSSFLPCLISVQLGGALAACGCTLRSVRHEWAGAATPLARLECAEHGRRDRRQRAHSERSLCTG